MRKYTPAHTGLVQKRISMGWFSGKISMKPVFSPQNMGFPAVFPLNQDLAESSAPGAFTALTARSKPNQHILNHG